MSTLESHKPFEINSIENITKPKKKHNSENNLKHPRKLNCDVSRWKSSKKNKNFGDTNYLSTFLFYVFMCSIIIAIILFSNYNLRCTKSINTESVIRKLRFHLYGQSGAIDILKTAFLSSELVKIIPFVGGTGQGKTYASQIIAGDLSEGSVHFLLKQSLDQKNALSVISKKISQCQYTLIIIDDLKIDDIVKSTNFASKILTDNIIRTKLDIILIFNTETVSSDLENIQINSTSPSIIHSHLINLGRPIFMTEFKAMENKYTRMCARDALNKYYIEPSEENVDRLMEMVQVQADVKGCKGLFSKAPLLYKNEF